jgi:hypothetical protein
MGAQKAQVRKDAEHDFRRGIDGAAGEQMRPYGPALTVGYGDVKVGTVTGECAGKREYFKMALKLCDMGAVGKAQAGFCQAARAGENAGGFYAVFHGKAFKLGKRVLSGMKPQSHMRHVRHAH